MFTAQELILISIFSKKKSTELFCLVLKKLQTLTSFYMAYSFNIRLSESSI